MSVSKIFPNPENQEVDDVWTTNDGYSAESRHDIFTGELYAFLAVSSKHRYYLQLRELYKNRICPDMEVYIRYAENISECYHSKKGTVFGWTGSQCKYLLNQASQDIAIYKLYHDIVPRDASLLNRYEENDNDLMLRESLAYAGIFLPGMDYSSLYPLAAMIPQHIPNLEHAIARWVVDENSIPSAINLASESNLENSLARLIANDTDDDTDDEYIYQSSVNIDQPLLTRDLCPRIRPLNQAYIGRHYPIRNIGYDLDSVNPLEEINNQHENYPDLFNQIDEVD